MSNACRLWKEKSDRDPDRLPVGGPASQAPEPLYAGGVALDPELRAYLEAMEQRLIRHTDEQIAVAREQAMLLTRVQDLEETFADHEKRITALEQRLDQRQRQ